MWCDHEMHLVQFQSAKLIRMHHILTLKQSGNNGWMHGRKKRMHEFRTYPFASMFVFANNVYLFNQCWITQLDSHKYFFFLSISSLSLFLILFVSVFVFPILFSFYMLFVCILFLCWNSNGRSSFGRDNSSIIRCIEKLSVKFLNEKSWKRISSQRQRTNAGGPSLNIHGQIHTYINWYIRPAYFANRKQSAFSYTQQCKHFQKRTNSGKFSHSLHRHNTVEP